MHVSKGSCHASRVMTIPMNGHCIKLLMNLLIVINGVLITIIVTMIMCSEECDNDFQSSIYMVMYVQYGKVYSCGIPIRQCNSSY